MNLKKFLNPSILQFLFGALVGAGIGTFAFLIITNRTNPIKIIIFAVAILLFIVLPFIVKKIVNYIQKKSVKLIGVNDVVGTEQYRTPFPSIEKDAGQATVVEMLMDYLRKEYNLPGSLEVNPDGKITIGVHIPQEQEGDFEYLAIDELTLPQPGLDTKTYEWQFAASSIMEHFEEVCKKTLGDKKK
jgi:hypothetical protein